MMQRPEVFNFLAPDYWCYYSKHQRDLPLYKDMPSKDANRMTKKQNLIRLLLKQLFIFSKPMHVLYTIASGWPISHFTHQFS